MTDKVAIYYWEYSDGVTRQGGTDLFPMIPPKGWSCWAYAAHIQNEFDEWMENNMKGKYDCTFRFNGGDPMFTIWIEDDEDATLFKLRWDNSVV